MGKLRDAARGLIQSKSIQGKKRDLGWKMVYVVTAMGFVGIMQLVLLEHRWYSSSSSQLKGFSSLPHIGAFKEETTLKRSSAKSTTSQHAAHSSKFKQSRRCCRFAIFLFN
jgi:hypothetical protein